jgi:hypothetical protein
MKQIFLSMDQPEKNMKELGKSGKRSCYKQRQQGAG